VDEPLSIVYRVNAGFIDRNSWIQDREIGGGRIIGEICHFVDAIHFIAQSVTRSVSAKALPNGGHYSDDNLAVVLELQNGSMATITYVSNGHRGVGKERLEVFGGGRSAILDDFRRLELVCNQKRQVSRALLRQDKGHRAECMEFVKTMSSGGPPPIPFREIVATTSTTFAIEESLRTGSNVAV
jgi:polar amino acid transport system substrate-binding protein